MKKDQKREQILLALAELLPGKHFHEITLEQVAKAAGVGKGTIYLYFKDKDALFFEFGLFSLTELTAQLAALPESPEADLSARIYRYAELIERFILTHRGWFGASGQLAAHMSRLTPAQLKQWCEHNEAAVAGLSEVLRRNPEIDRSRSDLAARMLFWLTAGHANHRAVSEAHDVDLKDILAIYCSGIVSGSNKQTGGSREK